MGRHVLRRAIVWVTVLLATLAAVATTLLVVHGVRPPEASPADPTVTPSPSATPDVPTAPLGIRVAQANLRVGMPRRQFRADVRAVMSAAPDFVTYNEVGLRRGRFLAPGHYRLSRTPGRYTGEAAVAFDSTRWKRVDGGTVLVSHRLARLWWQHHLWGLRYANWVTVANRATGRLVSVVSVHTAPSTRVTRDLLASSSRRIGRLVRRLSAVGPVVVAGDLNVSFHSTDYPRALLAQFGLTSTYDLTGRALSTGNHHGKAIDYVLVHPVPEFSVATQRVKRLHSDHNALLVDLLLAPPSGM